MFLAQSIKRQMIAKELKIALVKRGFLTPDSPSLDIADSVSQAVNRLGNADKIANEIVDRLKEVMPPELVMSDGLIGWYFNTFTVNVQLNYLLASVEKLNQS